jgi:ribosomal protein S18 acetylase RimI-like enzyme
MEAVQRLLPQLSSTAGPPTRQEVEEIVTSAATTLLVARDDPPDEVEGVTVEDVAVEDVTGQRQGAGAERDGRDADGPDGPEAKQRPAAGAGGPDGAIVGMLTLVTFRIPTGARARIEDVVVDDALRGRGTATALTRAALELAAATGAHTVDLTSRPSREAANRLYQHLGFEQRETVVYRFALPPE